MCSKTAVKVGVDEASCEAKIQLNLFHFYYLKDKPAAEEVKLLLQMEGKVLDFILEAVNSLCQPVDSFPALLESFKITPKCFN